jgi:hypothetical protein
MCFSRTGGHAFDPPNRLIAQRQPSRTWARSILIGAARLNRLYSRNSMICVFSRWRRRRSSERRNRRYSARASWRLRKPGSSNAQRFQLKVATVYKAGSSPGRKIGNSSRVKAVAVSVTGMELGAPRQRQQAELRGPRFDFAVMSASVRLVDLLLNFRRIDVREIGAKFGKRQQRLHDPERSQFRRMIGIDEVCAVIVDRGASEIEK